MFSIHHIGIATPDADRLVAFYCNHFGGKIIREFHWQKGNAAFDLRIGLPESAGRIFMLDFDNAKLEIFQFSAPEMPKAQPISVADPGLSHICFETTDCQAEYQRLLAAGVEFHAPPLTMPAGGIFTYARDPDGNIVELLQAPPVQP